MLRILLFLLLPLTGIAQTEIMLNDLSAFKKPSPNWTIEGGVVGNANATNLTTKAGKGVLLCTERNAKKYQTEDDLYSVLEHGDIKMAFDFMIPKGSNSGFYLQSRYEVQILDSWLKKSPNDGDCGAIYHRWDEARGKGNEGYEGHPPRQNACKAPGLWNHLEIDFKAPTFDATGKKLTNARFNKVVLNGVTVHENIELLGVTRGGIAGEVAKAPFRIQGDHGQVAFKNFIYEVYEPSNITFSPANYEHYEGGVTNFTPKQSTPAAKGIIPKPTAKLASVQSGFLLKFQGTFNVPQTGEYTFTSMWNGMGALTIDGDTLVKGWYLQHEEQKKSKQLTQGEHTYTIVYAKDFTWRKNGLAVFIQRPLSEKDAFTERTSLPEPDPVPLVELKTSDDVVLQRSFLMYGKKKKTHVISAGMPTGLHFSYDLNQGSFLQCWRGKFLDATQMWHDRGEPQTADPMGVVVKASEKFPLAYLESNQTIFPDSVSKNDLKYKGYKLEKRWSFSGTYNYPDFMYEYKGLKVRDIVTPLDQADGVNRHIRFEGQSTQNMPLYALIAEGTDINEVATNRYAVDNQQYYVQVFPTETNKIILRESNGKKQLLMPLNGLKEVSYHLIF